MATHSKTRTLARMLLRETRDKPVVFGAAVTHQRVRIINWLIGAHNAFGLLPDTLYLAANLFDQYLRERPAMVDQLLSAAAALWVAVKYTEDNPLSTQDLLDMTGNAFAVADLFKVKWFNNV